MEKWKYLGKKWLFPPGWLILLLVAGSTGALVMIFLKGMERHPLAYLVYVISFYMVLVLSVFLAIRVPAWYRHIKERVYRNPLGNRYLTDSVFKVRVSLYGSLILNTLYAVFKCVSGVYFSSIWWGTVGGYYLILAVIRFLLLRYMQQQGDLQAEYRSCRLCGIFLLLVNLVLSFIILFTILWDKGQRYPEVIVIASAVYTFYIVTASIKDLVCYRKRNSPVLMAAKAVRFGAALVSLLTLEITMLATFGEDPTLNITLIGISGLGVSVILLTMSIFMIHHGSKELQNKQDRSNLQWKKKM